MPDGALSFVERTEREVALALLQQDRLIDLIIPRGGESLMKTVTEHATIPVIKHDKGVCHLYVDASADLDAELDLRLRQRIAVRFDVEHADVGRDARQHHVARDQQLVLGAEERRVLRRVAAAAQALGER